VGSQVTWQIYGGIGKELKKKYSMVVGYRYLDVDYQNGGFLYDTLMSGPIARIQRSPQMKESGLAVCARIIGSTCFPLDRQRSA